MSQCNKSNLAASGLNAHQKEYSQALQVHNGSREWGHFATAFCILPNFSPMIRGVHVTFGHDMDNV